MIGFLFLGRELQRNRNRYTSAFGSRQAANSHFAAKQGRAFPHAQ